MVILATGITVILRALETGIVALDAARDRLLSAVLVRGVAAEIEAEQMLDKSAVRYFSGYFPAPYQRYGWRADVADPGLPGLSGTDNDSEIEFFEINAAVGRDDVIRYFEVKLWSWRLSETDDL